ncbi:MAG: beta-glucosidase [Cyclobacteriaceae bacterium]|nr:beta-glucosidase [Cyclobacteriaceae bacterium]
MVVTVFTWILSSCSTEPSEKLSIQTKPFDSHVEITWEVVPEADEYEIHLKSGGDDFNQLSAIKDTLFLDFIEKSNEEASLEYKIIAKKEGTKLAEARNITQLQPMTDDELIDMVQYYTFRYFWNGAEATSGMARERYHVDGDYPQNDKHIVTTGGTGFGIAAFPAAVERGWVSREEMLARVSKIVDFLSRADRFHGIWPHWLNGETGEVKAFSEEDDGGDLVESAFLMQGLLINREYFKNGNEAEKALSDKIDTLWKSMEWDWYTQGGKDVLYWHWSPRHEWAMNFPIQGYDECFITYVLAASSPTHSISADAYHKGWAREGNISVDIRAYDYPLSLRHNQSEQYGGPLFWAHYSFIGFNPTGLSDQYAHYFEHNRNHTLINRQWCIENPEGYAGYGEDLWGLTSSYSINGYAGHKPNYDLGVISPTAAISSIVYTPKESTEVLVNLYRNYGEKVFGKFGFYDALSVEENWYPQRYLAIDQGPILSMIENHRSGLPWSLFMQAPEIKEGLKKLNFEIAQ